MLQRIETLPHLPLRAQQAHKGTFGKVLLIGGSRGMAGSIALAGLSALRTGSGLVAIAAPASSQPIIAGYDPSYLTLPLPEDDQGRLSREALAEISKQAESASAVAIGPGLGQSPELRQLVEELYTSCPHPLVLDADALNNLADGSSSLPESKAPRILTPHPGEMGRLTGEKTGTIQQDREQFAADFARQNHCLVVLKGHQTVVTDGESIFVNPTGNNGLSTGGTGDVLTGTIASLLAQGIEPLKAACLGPYLHGLAGDLASGIVGEDGLIASDLPLYLAKAIRQFRSH